MLLVVNATDAPPIIGRSPQEPDANLVTATQRDPCSLNVTSSLVSAVVIPSAEEERAQTAKIIIGEIRELSANLVTAILVVRGVSNAIARRVSASARWAWPDIDATAAIAEPPDNCPTANPAASASTIGTKSFRV